MAVSMKDRWLDQGMSVLAEQGAAGVRVDYIAARLGVTKGSFHHHFNGITDYHRSLWARYENDSMNALQNAVSATAHLPPQQALTELQDTFVFDPLIEGAIRGWAFGNEEARAVQERVDAARLDALTGLWQQILTDPARARVAALVPHLLMIGASVAIPRPTKADMQELSTLLATLVPSVH
jgi:AcrR family transcriptional regulator